MGGGRGRGRGKGEGGEREGRGRRRGRGGGGRGDGGEGRWRGRGDGGEMEGEGRGRGRNKIADHFACFGNKEWGFVVYTKLGYVKLINLVIESSSRQLYIPLEKWKIFDEGRRRNVISHAVRSFNCA